MQKGVWRTLFFFIAMFLAPLPAVARVDSESDTKTPIKSEAETTGVANDASSPAMKRVDRLPHKLIYPGDALFPIELAKTGVQGEAKIELVLSGDAKLLSSTIVESSLSSELDKNALAYVNGETWKLPEDHPKGTETRYLLSVIFNRDSILTINLKTCAELNTDLAYFRSVRPAGQAKNLASLELIASLFTVQLIKTQGADEALKYAKAVNVITDETLSVCAAKPEALLIETYIGASKLHNIKF